MVGGELMIIDLQLIPRAAALSVAGNTRSSSTIVYTQEILQARGSRCMSDTLPCGCAFTDFEFLDFWGAFKKSISVACSIIDDF